MTNASSPEAAITLPASAPSRNGAVHIEGDQVGDMPRSTRARRRSGRLATGQAAFLQALPDNAPGGDVQAYSTRSIMTRTNPVTVIAFSISETTTDLVLLRGGGSARW